MRNAMGYSRLLVERAKYIMLSLLPSATSPFRHGQIIVLTANNEKQDQSNNPSYVNLVRSKDEGSSV